MTELRVRGSVAAYSGDVDPVMRVTGRLSALFLATDRTVTVDIAHIGPGPQDDRPGIGMVMTREDARAFATALLAAAS